MAVKAIEYSEFGAPFEVCKCIEVDDPADPQANEVVVAIEASAINPADLLIIRGEYPGPDTLPARQGIEGTGRIIAVGPDVKDYTVGDRVLLLGRGNWAEKVVCLAEQVVSIPEEIDVLQGIKNEVTTGEDIIFEYLYGDKLSAVVLAGTIAKKHLPYELRALAVEIGGISTAEQNKDYVTIAIQKMLGTNDSIGGVIECDLPYNLDLNPIKGEFSLIIHNLIKEITAIQFGNGIKDAKSNAKEYELSKNKILVTLGPDMKNLNKIPCLAGVRDVIIDSILAIVLL